jgi:hypothetical protein
MSTSHQARFTIVREILQIRVQSDHMLRQHAKHFNYVGHMCGSSQADARPSIVIFCPLKLLDELRKCLTEKDVRKHYHQDYRSIIPALKVPRFRIFFWGKEVELLWCPRITPVQISGIETLGMNSTSEPLGQLTFCGTMVTAEPTEERCSTVGCVLRIGNEYYGFTSAHAFDGVEYYRPTQTGAETKENNVEIDIDIDDDDDNNDSWSDEYKYDFNDHEDLDGTDYQLSSSSSSPNATEEKAPLGSKASENSAFKSRGISYQSFVKRPAVDGSAWNANHPNLGWALVLLDQPGLWQPNMCFDPSMPEKPIFFSSYASCLPSVKTEVLIVSSRSVSQRGILNYTPAYIGGYGIHRVEVWTVSIFGNDCE